MYLSLDGCDELTEREIPLCFLEVAFTMMTACRGQRAEVSPPVDVEKATLAVGCVGDSRWRVRA